MPAFWRTVLNKQGGKRLSALKRAKAKRRKHRKAVHRQRMTGKYRG